MKKNKNWRFNSPDSGMWFLQFNSLVPTEEWIGKSVDCDGNRSQCIWKVMSKKVLLCISGEKDGFLSKGAGTIDDPSERYKIDLTS